MQVIHARRLAAHLAVAFGLLVAGMEAHADYLAMSGAELYGRFCASCHGSGGRGDGPVSKALSVEVPDLTMLVRRQGTSLSKQTIERVIDGRHTVLAHGTRTMPVWGEEFSRTELGNPDAERATRLMIDRLVAHVLSLQKTASTKKDLP